jgi:hypothetical protein
MRFRNRGDACSRGAGEGLAGGAVQGTNNPERTEFAPKHDPWDEWLDGSPWQLTPGENFAAKVPTILASARAQANRRRGGTVRTRTLMNGERETLVLQFRHS